MTTEIIDISRGLYAELFGAAMGASERRTVVNALRNIRAAAFSLPETDFKLRRAQQYALWRD